MDKQNWLKNYLQGASNQYLIDAVQEIENCTQTGVLKDGIIRDLTREYSKVLNIQITTWSVVKDELLFELCRRLKDTL